MYLRTPKKLHLELTDMCNAKCPMCLRTNPNGLGESDLVSRSQLTIEDIRRIPYQFEQVNYCGNLGDPLLAKDLLPIVKHYEGAKQLIHTNGSLRNREFWIELAKIKNVIVIFGIDGSNSESHVRYRVNTSFDKILNNAKIFNNAGGKSTWQMIMFKHNELEVKEAKSLAKYYGFSNFETVTSRRFFGNPDFKYNYKNETYTLEPSGEVENSVYNGVHCKAKELEEIYIDSRGYVHPCPYITSENIKSPNIKSSSFDDIVYSVYFDEIDSIKESIATCRTVCGIKHRNKRDKIDLINL